MNTRLLKKQNGEQMRAAARWASPPLLGMVIFKQFHYHLLQAAYTRGGFRTDLGLEFSRLLSFQAGFHILPLILFFVWFFFATNQGAQLV